MGALGTVSVNGISMSDATGNNNKKTRIGFTSENMKGNQHAKKDFTKEMAQHVTSKEMYWVANMLSLPLSELKKKNLEEESLLVNVMVRKAMKGDLKAVQFLVEMIIGKPQQQTSITTPDGSNVSVKYVIEKKE